MTPSRSRRGKLRQPSDPINACRQSASQRDLNQGCGRWFRPPGTGVIFPLICRNPGRDNRSCPDSEVRKHSPRALSELRNRKDTGNSMILVPLLNPEFATVTAALRVRGTSSRSCDLGRQRPHAEPFSPMSTYRLDKLFHPQSAALVGGNPREKSLGRIVLRNMREGGFAGAIHLVNPDFAEIDGLRAVPTLADLAAAPDVAVVATPAEAVPTVVAQAAEVGCAAAVIISTGLGHGPGSIAEATAKAARRKGLRLVGPNCIGLMLPAAKLNATFAPRLAPAGDLALISQSGGIAAGMLEWAAQQRVGFSAIVSIGDQIDVDIGDLVDYFALDHRTRTILLYVEGIQDPRKFMSAARAAARIKPVVVIKAGRDAAAAKAAATHTGALAGE